jgi:hypothetical protein
MTESKTVELAWYDRMENDYPDLFTCHPECGAGWETLLRDLFDVVKARITDPAQFRLLQIKEKFGGLRFYYGLEDVSDEAREAIRNAVDAAEEKSFKTCELTGKPGKLISRNGWICVRADEDIKETDIVYDRP